MDGRGRSALSAGALGPSGTTRSRGPDAGSRRGGANGAPSRRSLVRNAFGLLFLTFPMAMTRGAGAPPARREAAEEPRKPAPRRGCGHLFSREKPRGRFRPCGTEKGKNRRPAARPSLFAAPRLRNL
ncbi:protein of unknown function [Methylacidimicrobium sp. AP8]|nr:protein of unknown function [Methylacidimicrobium sp. AP8]